MPVYQALGEAEEGGLHKFQTTLVHTSSPGKSGPMLKLFQVCVFKDITAHSLCRYLEGLRGVGVGREMLLFGVY